MVLSRYVAQDKGTRIRNAEFDYRAGVLLYRHLDNRAARNRHIYNRRSLAHSGCDLLRDRQDKRRSGLSSGDIALA